MRVSGAAGVSIVSASCVCINGAFPRYLSCAPRQRSFTCQRYALQGNSHCRGQSQWGIHSGASMAGLTELPCCPHCSGRGESGAQSFGVRSYLHLFYEDCAFLTPRDVEEDLQNKGDPVSSWSWYSLLWKASLTVGLLLVVVGGAALGVGLVLSPQIEGFGEGELLMVDVRAVGHNSALRACRLAGALLLAVGGTVLLACALAWPVCRAGERIQDDRASSAWSFPAVSPIQLPLPVSLAQTLSVQPKPAL
ncbi:neurensin-1-like isoform X2 [Conger conger]|uniref:neurensin-1-like isoform X2 n=1 Tax=Conger conger TaxID=82655 RepID=UPI002A59DE98|nr:neurensin-1-like isoform X2 [Conger conger]